MSTAARKILEDALALPDDERLRLAAELLASVDGPADEDWEASWLAELDRRSQDADPGEEWHVIRSRLAQRFDR